MQALQFLTDRNLLNLYLLSPNIFAFEFWFIKIALSCSILEVDHLYFVN